MFHVKQFCPIGTENLTRPRTLRCLEMSRIARKIGAVGGWKGGRAEFERGLIRARTSYGRERAKAGGVKVGRPSKLTEH
jgi:hypothetical protein